jgi:hypothetical protein
MHYLFGAVRVATLTLLTLTALSACLSCGVVTAKLSGHAVTLRSSPTVLADTLMLGSTSTRILPGKLPRASWSAAMLLALYRIGVPFFSVSTRLLPEIVYNLTALDSEGYDLTSGSKRSV